MLPLIISSDSHVLEPPDLWQTRIDTAFRDRGARIERIDGGDRVVVEADQILSGIGLISTPASSALDVGHRRCGSLSGIATSAAAISRCRPR